MEECAKPQFSSCIFGKNHTLLTAVNGENVTEDGFNWLSEDCDAKAECF